MISLSDLRARLGMPAGDGGDLAAIRADVVAEFERETKRLWERRANYVETFRLRPSTRTFVLLELWPVETLTKVEESQDGGTWTELVAATPEYVLARDNRLERVGCYFAPWVRVTYTGGYVAAPTGQQKQTPSDIREALLVQANFKHIRNRPGALLATQSQNFEAGAGELLKGDCHPTFTACVAQRKRKV